MLTINQNQYAQLQDARNESVTESITDWLMEEFPVAQGDRASILEEVRSIARVAWEWGITSGNMVRLHVYAAKVLGKDYYTMVPGLERALSDPDLTDNLKEAWLSGWLDALKEPDSRQVGHP